jgi:hypothetical protein
MKGAKEADSTGNQAYNLQATYLNISFEASLSEPLEQLSFPVLGKQLGHVTGKACRIFYGETYWKTTIWWSSIRQLEYYIGIYNKHNVSLM